MAAKLPDDILELSRQCIECDGPGCHKVAPRKKCSRCKASWYCSVECQKQDWKTHKEICGIIVQNKKFFREQDEKAATFVEPANSECGICLEEDISDRRVIVPGCRHGFCSRCLTDWQTTSQMQGNNSFLYCPLCRGYVMAGVEEDILMRAEFYGGRAAAKGVSEKTKDENLRIAFAELDKLLSAQDKSTMFRPLLVKADILRKLKQTQQAMGILEQVEEMDREAVRNRAQMDAMKELCLAPDCDQATRLRLIEVAQKMAASRTLVRVGDQQEYFRIMRTKIQLAEVKADLGDYQEGLAILEGFIEELGENEAEDWMLHVRMNNILLRCHHGAGNLEKAITICQEVIPECRTVPGPYKFLALSQKDMCDVEAAKSTILRALLHVVDWDDEYTQEDFVELYEELKKLHGR